MGCDGGTIPKRKEIVKNKNKEQERCKDADRSAKWQFCHLSGLPLKKPIVACQLGRLYNKVTILEYLLNNSKQNPTSSSSTTTNTIKHIKSLKDVKELNLKEKSDFNSTHQASSGREQFKAQYACPISGLEINGTYKFYYILTCGCVVSERALKEVPNESSCISCSKSYDPELDLIVLYGDEDEIKNLEEKIILRKRRQKLGKKLSSTLAIEKPKSLTQDQQQSSSSFTSTRKYSNKDSDKSYSKRRRVEEVR